MKLYATVTSERASKGQGGNKEIVIDLKNEDKLTVAQMTFGALGDLLYLSLDGCSEDLELSNFDEAIKLQKQAKQKGNKQKGNGCKYGHAICLQADGRCIDKS